MNKIFFLFNNPVDNGLVGIILFVAFIILLFILGREIILWYFRINENTETLKKISSSLEKISTAMVFLAEDVDYKNKNIKTAELGETISEDEVKNDK